MKIAIFPGTFDPFTRGHEDIARRGAKMFDHLIIGIGHNSQKKRYFQVELMIEKITTALQDTPNISVQSYDMLTAEFARKNGATYILRGLRNTTDFEYENSIAQANKQIYSDLETVFLITSPAYAHISSTITREIYKYGQPIVDFVPYSL